MKVLKFSFLALLLLVIAAALYVATLDLNQYRDEIAHQAELATGRKLSIDGDLRLAWSLIPTLSVEGVTLANAPWGKAPYLVHVGQLEARVGLLPIFTGHLQLKRLALVDTDVLLETDAAGHGNWTLTPQAPAPAAGGPEAPAVLPSFSVQEVRVENARFSFREGATGKTTRIGLQELSLRADGLSDPLRLAALGSYNDIAVNAEGTLGPLAELLADRDYAFELKTGVRSAKLHLAGNIAHPLSAKGAHVKLDASVPTLADLNPLLETDLPAYGPITVTGVFTVPDPSRVQFSDLRIGAAESDLAGEGAIDLAAQRPEISAKLDSRMLDLRPFTAAEPAPREKPERLFSKEKLPLAALRKLNADMQISARQLRAGDMVLEDLSLPLKLDKGRLSIAPLKARLAGGDLVLKLRLNAATDTPALETDVLVKQLELGQLPGLQKEKKFEGGRTDVTIQARGRGHSVAEIMAGLDGTLLVQVGKGRIPNSSVDLAGADILLETFSRLNPLSSKEPSSELDCAVIKFAVRDGIAETDKGIAVQTSKMSVVGSGAINLKSEELDLGMRPYAREGVGLGLGTIAGAARIGGTLADPKPVIDAANVLRTGVTAGAAVVTFGLSTLAQGIFDKSTADPHPCETALGNLPVKTAKQQQGSAAGEAPEPQSQPESASPIKSAGDAVKSALDSLFGK